MEENTTKKGNKKIIVAVVLVIVLVVIGGAIAAGIFAYNLINPAPAKLIENSFSQLDAITDIQSSELGNIVDIGALVGSELNDEETKLYFEKFDYKVINETIDGDTAVVEVEITNKDFGLAFTNAFNKVVEKALAGETIDETTVLGFVHDELAKTDIPVVTIQDKITLTKVDGLWQITDERLGFILLPNLEQVINSLGN